MDILDAQIDPEDTPKFSMRRVVRGLSHSGGLFRRVVRTLSLLRRVTSEVSFKNSNFSNLTWKVLQLVSESVKTS